MQLDQNPFFRKPITSWYDSNFMCWMVVIFCMLVLVFALFGVYLASLEPAFQPHLWFPSFLAGLNFFLVIKILLRMKKRNKNS